MNATVEKSQLSNTFDAYSGVNLADTNKTIVSNLSKAELDRYTNAICKINHRRELNQKDLAVFEKIDAITYKHHGMCLKDSLVTKARINACKKYKVEFIDRDHLLDHMNSVLAINSNVSIMSEKNEKLANLFIEKFDETMPFKVSKIAYKVKARVDLNLDDLVILSEMEELASVELGLSIVDSELSSAIEKACKKLGIYFQNLQEAVLH